MITKTKSGHSQTLEEFWPTSGIAIDYTWFQTQPQFRNSFSNDLEMARSLAKTTESLVFAYLAANLNSKSIPLREFMDGFEEKILHACLRLTYFNQKNAATLMHLKPTTLFAKMRKCGICGRRMKLSRRLNASNFLEPPR